MNDTNHFLNKTHQILAEATTPSDVFGDLNHCTSADLKRCFRILAQQVHPDHHPRQSKLAHEAFRLLQTWHQLAQSQLAAQQGGLRIESRRGLYISTAVPQQTPICTLYPAKLARQKVLLKVSRHPKHNPLLTAEANVLTHIHRSLDSDPLLTHFPTLIESFRIRDEAGKERFTNVLEPSPGWVSVADIIAAYPNGIHPADAAWMFNRLLATLGKTHELGLVHGAVLPCHLLLNLSDHNGRLINWCYSGSSGHPLLAVHPEHFHFYPPEILNNQPATAVSDIYMAATLMLALLGGDVEQKQFPTTTPKPIQALLKSCLIPAPQRRPNDVWELFDQFQEILRRLYGPPTFRPFTLAHR